MNLEEAGGDANIQTIAVCETRILSCLFLMRNICIIFWNTKLLRSFLKKLKLGKEGLLKIIYKGFRLYEHAESVPTTEMSCRTGYPWHCCGCHHVLLYESPDLIFPGWQDPLWLFFLRYINAFTLTSIQSFSPESV